MSLPLFSTDILNNSKLRGPILSGTPILNNYARKTVQVCEEINDLRIRYKDETDKSELNLSTLSLMLKYKITTVETIDKLVNNGKLQINNIESVLKDYRN